MRLVTYDRGGHRRLGAILEGEVVDLPDAIGHPAFPSTLEGLVSSSRGTVLDAARDALEREDAMHWRVPRPRVLPPLFPQSLLSPTALEIDRTIVGPEQPVPWPSGAAWLDYEPMIAAVIGNETSEATASEVSRDVFGYTLVSDWRARSEDGGPVESADGVPLAIGPCVVTTDEFDPTSTVVQVTIDEEERLRGDLNGIVGRLHELIASASKYTPLERGDAFALAPFPSSNDDDDPSRRLWPGVLVELSADGIGTLRNRISARARTPVD